MSAAEILSELPKLSPEEIDAIFFSAAALRERELDPSPELRAAIEEAEAAFETQGGTPLDEFEKIVKSWSTK